MQNINTPAPPPTHYLYPAAALGKDNRELEARLRQADAAAAEARSARAGADAERVRMERDLQSALAKVGASGEGSVPA